MPFLGIKEFESGGAVGEKEGERSVVGMFFAAMCHGGGGRVSGFFCSCVCVCVCGWEGVVEDEAEGGVLL